MLKPIIFPLLGFLLLALVGCATEPQTLIIPRSAFTVPGIAFVTERNGNRDINLVQPDGSGLTLLITSPEPDSDPAFSPDGTTLAFRSRRDGSSDIFLSAADGTGDWLNLVGDPATSPNDEFAPAWHPSGSSLALVTDRFQPPIGDCDGLHGVHHLAFLSLDTTDLLLEHFDDFPGEQGTLAWSPNGMQLVFSSVCTGSQTHLYRWDRATRKVDRLMEGDFSETNPAFSPDGLLLAFTSSRAGNTDIYLLDLQIGTIRNLTQSEFPSSQPTWSPDGKWIAFVRNLGGNQEIFVINVEGGEARNLTNSPGPDLLPAWSPFP